MTNDRDFVRIGSNVDHGGIVIYNDVTVLRERPANAVEALDRIVNAYPRSELENAVVWFDDWW
jgi:hypothetical protein